MKRARITQNIRTLSTLYRLIDHYERATFPTTKGATLRKIRRIAQGERIKVLKADNGKLKIEKVGKKCKKQ